MKAPKYAVWGFPPMRNPMAIPMRASKAANETISRAERRLLAEMASHIIGLLMGLR